MILKNTITLNTCNRNFSYRSSNTLVDHKDKGILYLTDFLKEKSIRCIIILV